MRPETTLELLATPAELSGVRRALRDYGTDVQLCASELVTNVIQHLGEGVPVTVRAWCDDGGRTRLEVTDPAPGCCPSCVRRWAPTRSRGGDWRYWTRSR
ncbi:ATP-binding protein [Streptomyces sp. NPDC051740]|uniref:ATP-binding protein n=1 Tax=Streptomyces sp. NPDC051740 TaxID=3365673 RepID=UPI0037AF8D70